MSFGRRDEILQSDMDSLASGANAVLSPATAYDFSANDWTVELGRIRSDLFRATNLDYILGTIADDPSLVEITDEWLTSGPHVVGVGRTLWALSYDSRSAGPSDMRQFLYKGTILGSAASFVYSRSRNPASFLIYTGAILGTSDRQASFSGASPWQALYSATNDLTRLEARIVVDFTWTGGGSPPGSPESQFSLGYTVNGVDQVATDVTFSFVGSGSPTNQNVRMTLDILTTNCPIGTDIPIVLSWTSGGYTHTTDSGRVYGFWAVDHSGPDFDDYYKKCIFPRNEIAREFAHFAASRTLVEADILDSNSLVEAMRLGARAIDTYLYGRLSLATRTIIEDPLQYPPVSPTLLTMVVDDLNAVITGDSIYDATRFSGVTLRALTRWLAGLDDLSGAMLELLNRLLLEDAYPSYIRRIDTTITGADTDVVYMGTHSITVGDVFTATGSGNCPFGFQCSDPLCDGIWIAQTLPPPAINGFCDIGLPNYYDSEQWPPLGSPPVGYRAIGSTMRSAAPSSAGGTIGQHYPSVDNRPSRWPVIQDIDFGYWSKNTVPIGYWSHDGRGWQWPVKDFTVAAGGVWNGSFLLAQNPNSTYGTFSFEFKAFGSGVLYVSKDGIPDPDNPTTYDFTASKKFIIPDDVPAPLLAAYNAGTTVYFTFHNNTAASTLFGYRTSTFYKLDPNGDTIQIEPFFFPYESPPTDAAPLGVPAVATYSAFRYWEGHYWPRIPTRGYAVYEIVVQLPPTVNAYGIYTPTVSVGNTVVKVGVMVGTGIFTGAITGVYPGEFMEFDTITIPNGESRKIQSVFYPVLEACPLAFQADLKVDVFAYVSYQPVFHSQPNTDLSSVPDGSVVQFEHSGPATMLDQSYYAATQYWMFRAYSAGGHPLGAAQDILWPPSGEIVRQHRDLLLLL